MPINARTATFIGLNVIRVLSIVSLILVFASTIFVMVNNVKAMNRFEADKGLDVDLSNCDYIENSTIPNQPAGAFWAIVSSLLILFQTVVLFLSEISWPMIFFDRYFPVLGSEFGLGALGIFQTLIATQILSHFVDDFTLVSAFFLFSIGCLNIFVGLIFRASSKPKRSISAWRNSNSQARAILPPPVYSPHSTFSIKKNNTIIRGSIYKPSSSPLPDEKFGYGFSSRGEKAANLDGYTLKTPEEALPKGSALPSSRRSSTRSTSSTESLRTNITGTRYSQTPTRSSSPHTRDGSEVYRPAKTNHGKPIPF